MLRHTEPARPGGRRRRTCKDRETRMNTETLQRHTIRADRVRVEHHGERRYPLDRAPRLIGPTVMMRTREPLCLRTRVPGAQVGRVRISCGFFAF